METREERIARIRQRHERRAAKAAQEAAQRFKAAQSIADFIPMGQPILVGHHSEKRHRRDLERIDNNMRKGVEAANMRDRATQAAASAEHTGIASSDADAVDLLRAKLADLEAHQERIKAWNKAARKPGSTWEGCAAASGIAVEDARAALRFEVECADRRRKEAGRVDRLGFPVQYPRYALTNNGANLKRVRERLAEVERAQSTPVKRIDGRDGVTIEDDPPANRVRLIFPGKPPEDVRALLKRNGFRWARSLGCWQAYRNYRSVTFAATYRVAAQAEPAQFAVEDKPTCGCEVNAPEADPAQWPCPCGDHCKEPECMAFRAYKADHPGSPPETINSEDFAAYREALGLTD